jgi:putative ABC transport system permease protein
MISSLMRSKTGPMLVALQIAVTLAIVINSLYIVLQRVEKINRDTGMDVENVIIVYVRGFGDNFDVVDSVRNDIDLLRSIPGVSAVSVTNQVPLSGSGSGSGLHMERYRAGCHGRGVDSRSKLLPGRDRVHFA